MDTCRYFNIYQTRVSVAGRVGNRGICVQQ